MSDRLSEAWAAGRSKIPTAVAVVALAIAVMPILYSPPLPLDTQPFPDAPTYADTAFQIANGNGFRTVVDERLPSFAEHRILQASRSRSRPSSSSAGTTGPPPRPAPSGSRCFS